MYGININVPTINVDTSGIRVAGASAQKTLNNGKRLALVGSLTPYKIKTIPTLGKSRPLSEEDREAVTNIVRELNENGWLTEDDSQWCCEQGIPVV